jgi:hypothetical protein
MLACVLIGSVADLTLNHNKARNRRVQGSNLTMENAIRRELDSTLTASWCAANLIRLNLEKLNCIADPPENPPSDYERWASIGHLLLDPEDSQSRGCCLYALREMVELFCSVATKLQLHCDAPKEGKDQTVQESTASVIDLAAFRTTKYDSSSTAN